MLAKMAGVGAILLIVVSVVITTRRDEMNAEEFAAHVLSGGTSKDFWEAYEVTRKRFPPGTDWRLVEAFITERRNDLSDRFALYVNYEDSDGNASWKPMLGDIVKIGMFIVPRQLNRYGNVVSLYAEIDDKGQVKGWQYEGMGLVGDWTEAFSGWEEIGTQSFRGK